MKLYKLFASTCSSGKEIENARKTCHALDLNYPYSVPIQVEALSLSEAIMKYQKTAEFKIFLDSVNTDKTIQFFCVNDNGEYELCN